MAQNKAKPMTKDEVATLLDLIEGNKFIMSKSTNATTNRLKEQAWLSLTESFNSGSETPRTAYQLRLKWENLKKSARKRALDIRNLRSSSDSDGRPIKFFPPDEILGRVASLLADIQDEDDNIPLEELMKQEEEIFIPTTSPNCVEPDLSPVQEINNVLKRKISNDDEMESRIERNKAVADYYKERKLLVQKQTQQKNMEIEKIKLDLEYRRLEIEILKRKNNMDPLY